MERVASVLRVAGKHSATSHHFTQQYRTNKYLVMSGPLSGVLSITRHYGVMHDDHQSHGKNQIVVMDGATVRTDLEALRQAIRAGLGFLSGNPNRPLCPVAQ